MLRAPDMDFGDVVRGRASVRHYSEEAVAPEVLTALLEEARWAPSPGNLQPWRALLLGPDACATLRERFEEAGWESVFPSLRQVITTHHPALASAPAHRVSELAVTAFEKQIRVTGRPSAIVIYSEHSWRELWGLLCSGVATLAYRVRQKPSLGAKLRYLAQMALRLPNDLRVARDTFTASLAAFTYALTLGARARGLESCIQFSYNHVGRAVHRHLGLPRSAELFGVVLVGHASLADAGMPIDTRSRRPLEPRWLPELSAPRRAGG